MAEEATEATEAVEEGASAPNPKLAEIIDAIGRTSLKGLLALLDRARVVIAPDSGPVHMANALGTPTLGLYATTNPDRAAPYLWRDHVVNRYPDAVRRYLKKPIEAVSWGTRVRHADAMALICSVSSPWWPASAQASASSSSILHDTRACRGIVS